MSARYGRTVLESTQSHRKTAMTDEEFKEMDDLRRAISDNPAYVHPDKQERFTELFVKSLIDLGANSTTGT